MLSQVFAFNSAAAACAQSEGAHALQAQLPNDVYDRIQSCISSNLVDVRYECFRYHDDTDRWTARVAITTEEALLHHGITCANHGLLAMQLLDAHREPVAGVVVFDGVRITAPDGMVSWNAFADAANENGGVAIDCEPLFGNIANASKCEQLAVVESEAVCVQITHLNTLIVKHGLAVLLKSS
jgi:hypothetical protein